MRLLLILMVNGANPRTRTTCHTYCEAAPPEKLLFPLASCLALRE